MQIFQRSAISSRVRFARGRNWRNENVLHSEGLAWFLQLG